MEKFEFIRRGGSWVEVIRNWIVWNCRSGSRVIFKENDMIAPDITVKQLEELGEEIAYAAYEDHCTQAGAVEMIYEELCRYRGVKATGAVDDEIMGDAKSLAKSLGFK